MPGNLPRDGSLFPNIPADLYLERQLVAGVVELPTPTAPAFLITRLGD